MKIRVLVSYCVLLIAAQVKPANAQEQQASFFADSLKTIAGELKIVPLDESCKFNVTLNGRIVLRTDCQDESNIWATTPIPVIHTFYKSGGVRPFDEVVLLQMNMLGNACNGGPLLFIGLKQDKSYSLSESIDFCGGAPPVVTWSHDKVTVLLPGGLPNRGTGYIPSETWIYQNGLVRQVRRNKRRS
jgi:hypothetical protein